MYISAIAAYLFAYYFVNVALIPSRLKTALKYPPGKRMKPFDCVTCLSVWVCLVLILLPEQVSSVTACLFLAGFLGVKIK